MYWGGCLLFMPYYSVISGTDYIIGGWDYIIAGTDFIITATDYRINAFSFNNTKHTTRFLSAKRHFPLRNFFLYNLQNKRFLSFWFISEHNWFISEEVEIS